MRQQSSVARLLDPRHGGDFVVALAAARPVRHHRMISSKSDASPTRPGRSQRTTANAMRQSQDADRPSSMAGAASHGAAHPGRRRARTGHHRHPPTKPARRLWPGACRQRNFNRRRCSHPRHSPIIRLANPFGARTALDQLGRHDKRAAITQRPEDRAQEPSSCQFGLSYVLPGSAEARKYFPAFANTEPTAGDGESGLWLACRAGFAEAETSLKADLPGRGAAMSPT